MHEFRLPGVIRFGWGAVEGAGAEAARLGRRALLVMGRGAMKRSGAAARLQGLLSQAGLECIVYDGVESDPSGTTIDRGAELARTERCDCVIGLGGGSPMDAARGIAAIAVLGGSIIDYVRGKTADRPGLPLMNIATTAGTASEITSVAVVLDEERRSKVGVRSPFWFARVAITDPELTLTMSPALTAATGIDALTHAAESYLSTGATAPSEALALRGIELVGCHLVAACADGSDRAAREGMALASMLGGMAFANSGVGLVHGFAHPLGARLGVPHGVACGRMLPQVMRFNAAAAPERVSAVGCALTRQHSLTPEEAAAAVASLVREVGAPLGLRDLAITDDQLVELADETLKVGAVRTNARPVTREDALELLALARET